MEAHAIFLDIDGTLVPAGNHGVVPDRNVRALLAAQAQGHFVFLNTGRCRAHVRPSVSQCIPFDGILSGIGAHVTVRDRVIRNEVLPGDKVREVYRFLVERGTPVLFGNADHAWVINRRDLWPTPLAVSVDPSDPPKDFCLDGIQKIDLPDPALPPAGTLELLGEFADYYHHGDSVEAFPRGCTKANALELAAAHLGIPTSRCIAMGDSLNDLDMLNAAGHRVAMGNATDALKRAATLVTATSSECGVAEALKALLGIES
jgi:hydroxymethylpyrimidine pyrophosphatase-like HAD family hydrolase